MTFPEALSNTDDNAPILLPGADPNDACGFVKTDGDAGGFFWCVCDERCKCEHCKETKK